MTTYAELKEQIEKLQAEADDLRRQETAEVIADINKKIKTYSLTAADLEFSDRKHVTPKVGKAAGKPQYVNPDTGETWVGRGAPPTWLRPYSVEDRKKFLIEKSK